jgi:DNA-binding FadR family transcriptional regulator
MTNPASPLTRDTLSSKVAEYVIGTISSQHLKPGDPVLPEIQASLALGVSRPIVREAYRSLAAAGIIEVASGKRPRVGSISAGAITELFRHAVRTDQASSAQVLQLRRAVEIDAARLAATHRTDDELAHLETARRALRAAGTKVDAFVEADVDFHLTIAGATRNPLFALFIEALRQPLETSMALGLQSRTSRTELERVQQLHDEIATAIRDQDAERAGSAMASHFDDAVSTILARGVRS